MKKYLIKANALIAHRSYETSLFVLAGVIGVLSYFIFVLNKTVSSNPIPSNLKQTEIISCAPNSLLTAGNYFYNGLETIEPNDNRRHAGQLKDGVLTITLEAREGVWYPETPANPGVVVYAFAEEGKPLQLPGPLIRVPEGTEIKLTVRNKIEDQPINLHGFHSRPGKIKDSVTVAPGAVWSTRFKTGTAGTYYYYGTTSLLPRAGKWPLGKDGQMYGGLIIDKAGSKPDTAERIFIIGRNVERASNRVTVGINGLSWPFTEILNYKTGEPVHWRVINASSSGHPMHLHGFYFNVHSIGDGETDKQYAIKDTRRVITQLLWMGQTMRMSWIPERPGNWLFHCHMLKHISPQDVRLRPEPPSGIHDLQDHVREGMAGLIMGIHILPNGAIPGKKTVSIANRRQINLLVKEFASPFDTIYSSHGLGFVLQENNTLANAVPSVPGPVVIIHQDEPVAINVINQSNEPTTVHWHGIELENYFDGVAGWGFDGPQTTPLVEVGHSFAAQMTAPRPGTFIYHTHMHDKQLMRGMYGPLLVLKPGEKFDSTKDKIIVISDVGRSKKLADRKYLINGSLNPEPLRLRKGKKYRLRLINITEDGWAIQLSLLFNKQPVILKELAKDGMELPAGQSVHIKANRQLIGVGETMDFEFLPQQKGVYKLQLDYNNEAVDIRIAEMRILVE